MRTLITLLILSLFLVSCSQENEFLEVEEEKINEIIQEEVVEDVKEEEEEKEVEVEKTEVSFEVKESVDYDNCIIDKQKFEVLKENTDIFNYDDFCIKKYQLIGTIKSGEPDKIVVRSCGKDNPYTLQQFKKGDETFVYNISKNNGNLCESNPGDKWDNKIKYIDTIANDIKYSFSYYKDGEKIPEIDDKKYILDIERGNMIYIDKSDDSIRNIDGRKRYVFEGNKLYKVTGLGDIGESKMRFYNNNYIIYESYEIGKDYLLIYDLELNKIISDNLRLYNDNDILQNYLDKINTQDKEKIDKLLDDGYKLNYIIDNHEVDDLREIVESIDRNEWKKEQEYSLERILTDNHEKGFSKGVDIVGF